MHNTINMTVYIWAAGAPLATNNAATWQHELRPDCAITIITISLVRLVECAPKWCFEVAVAQEEFAEVAFAIRPVRAHASIMFGDVPEPRVVQGGIFGPGERREDGETL